MVSASIVALTAASGTAIAQYQNSSPRDSVRVAERADQMQTSLTKAISLAEQHTNGVAIGVRLTTSDEYFRTNANGLGDSRDSQYGNDWRDSGNSRDGAEWRDSNYRDNDDRRDSDNWNSNDRRDARDHGRVPNDERPPYTREKRMETDQRDASRRNDNTDQRDATRSANQQDASRRNDSDRRDPWQTSNTGQDSRYSQSASSSPIFAIVTCVVDRARVRDVVVDMSRGSVLGMQSASAAYDGMQDQYSQSPQYSRDYDMRNRYSQPASSSQSGFQLVRATDLMNATVRNGQGQRIGDIDELVLNPDSNEIVYGVLRRGGFMGFNESRYAIPTGELSAPSNGRIRMNLNNSDFRGKSGFEDGKWPTQADSEWSTSWNQNTQNTQRATRILKATELIGTTVKCSDGQTLGEINDLIVEPQSGRVVYAVVDSDRGEIVAPMSVLQTKGDARVVNLSSEEVKALPTIDPRSEPNWNDARWNRRMHENFNTKLNLNPSSSNRSR